MATITCPTCGYENLINMDFCQMCGTPLSGTSRVEVAGSEPVSVLYDEIIKGATLYCPSCGKRIPENSTFCLYCGTRITDLNAPTPQRIVVEWEYKDFVYEWPKNKRPWRAISRSSNPNATTLLMAQLEFWHDYQAKIYKALQQWLDEGWEPVSEVSSACIEINRSRSHRDKTAGYWIAYLFFSLPTFGLLFLIALMNTSEIAEPTRFVLQMRAPKGTLAPQTFPSLKPDETLKTDGSPLEKKVEKATRASKSMEAPTPAEVTAKTVSVHEATASRRNWLILLAIITLLGLLGVGMFFGGGQISANRLSMPTAAPPSMAVDATEPSSPPSETTGSAARLVPEPTSTPTPIETSPVTPTLTQTSAPTQKPTLTRRPQATRTLILAPTKTPSLIQSTLLTPSTPLPSSTATLISTLSPTFTHTPTLTPLPTNTSTPLPVPTDTPTGTPTNPPLNTPTNTPTPLLPTNTPTATLLPPTPTLSPTSTQQSAPAAPSDFTVSFVDNRLILTWTDNSDSEDGFYLTVSNTCSWCSSSTTLEPNVTSYDWRVCHSDPWTFTISAFNSAGSSSVVSTTGLLPCNH